MPEPIYVADVFKPFVFEILLERAWEYQNRKPANMRAVTRFIKMLKGIANA